MDDCVGSVVDIGSVDQRSSAIDDKQPTTAGSSNDPTNELLIAWSPDEMRSKHHYGHIAWCEDYLLGHSLRSRVMTSDPVRVGRFRFCAHQSAPSMGNRRGRNMDERLNARAASGIENHLGAAHIDIFEVAPATLDPYPSS
jgi:hypothetical protein